MFRLFLRSGIRKSWRFVGVDKAFGCVKVCLGDMIDVSLFCNTSIFEQDAKR